MKLQAFGASNLEKLTPSLNQMLSTTNTKLPMLMNNTASATESYSSQRRLAEIMVPTHCSNAVFLFGCIDRYSILVL
jgi:hypothetical protein